MTAALLIGLLGTPIALMTLLRINASLVFLSICLGSVLLQFVSQDAIRLVGVFSARGSGLSESNVKLVLLLVPVVLTMLFMIHTVRGKKLILNVLPAAGASVLLILLVKPLLSPGLAGSIAASPLWKQLEQSQDLIVGSSAFIVLLFLWLQRPKAPEHDRKHR